jgi:hypothetical protein
MSALAGDAKVVFDVLSGNIYAVGADLAKEKLGWDDYWKSVAATNADMAKYTADAKLGAAEADNLTDKTQHHATALERAVKASHDFWAEYNAGLTKATTTLPRFVSLSIKPSPPCILVRCKCPLANGATFRRLKPRRSYGRKSPPAAYRKARTSTPSARWVNPRHALSRRFPTWDAR